MKDDTKYELSDANSTLTLAKEVANFIKENKLFLMVHNKPHINIEAWQYAAANLGIVPVVDKVENLSMEGEVKYGAFVTLYQIGSWQKVSAGYAICSNKESGKKSNPEFAICSMAQTRAEGKAYRLLLGWLIKAAGYEATPSEEMDSIGHEEAQPPAKKQAPNKTHVPPKESKPASVKAKGALTILLNSKVIEPKQQAAVFTAMNTMDEEKVQQYIDYYTPFPDKEAVTK